MKKKVLIIIEALSYGGSNIAAMHFQEKLDPDKFECVYCVRRDEIGAFEQEILDKGIRVIHVPNTELGYLNSYKFYKKIMTDERFDIVHCHLPFVSGIVLFAAKQCGVKKRVAHSHFSQPYTDTAIYSKKKQAVAKIYRIVMRGFLKMFCNVKIACSEPAGYFLYGKKEFKKNGVVLNNGIDTDRFLFNNDVRSEVREELKISSQSIVLGHIGQLYSVKNQSFIIDVFNELHKEHKDSYLLLVGDGNDRDILKDKVSSLKLDDSIMLLGLRNDANRLYQAMDCFVFPSIHEGFPLTLVEAQASKLPCVVSDTVTKTTKLNENIDYLSINASEDIWVSKIEELIGIDREGIDNSKVLELFDIKNISKKIEDLYLN